MKEADAARARFHAAQWRHYRKLGDHGPELTREAWLETLESVQARLEAQLEEGAPEGPVRQKLAELERERARIMSLFDSGREHLLLDAFADHFQALVTAVIEAATSIDHHTDETVIIGTFPTGAINARVFPPGDSGDGERFIVIDSGMPIFANLVSKAVTRCFPIRQELGRHRVRYEDDPQIVAGEIETRGAELVRPYGELLEAYTVHGNPGAANPYFTDPRWDPIATSWRETMELFIVAHEYAHVLRGVKPQFDGQERREQDAARLFDWHLTRHDEFEADALAARIVAARRRRDGMSPGLALMPIRALFHALHDLTRAIYILREGSIEDGQAAFDRHYLTADERGDGHPSPLERLQNVDAVFEELAGPDGEELSKRRELIETVMSYYGGFVEKAMDVALKRGVTLHPRWSV